jgi:Effector-associated domain 1
MSEPPPANRTLFLNEVLADLYPSVEEARRVVVRAGLRPAFVRFDAAAIINWFNILEDAARRGRTENVIDAALCDFPDHPLLLSAKRQESLSSPSKAGSITQNVNVTGSGNEVLVAGGDLYKVTVHPPRAAGEDR